MKKFTKRRRSGIIVLTLIMVFSVSYCTQVTIEAKPSGENREVHIASEEDNSKPVYRLYNSVSGEHIYTPDEEEKNVLSATADWNYEGVAWKSYTRGTPVYRLYNPILCNHLYTTDKNEVSVLTSQQGWVADFNGAPLFNYNGDKPVYRLYNQGLRGMHHLTIDKNEYDVLVQYGWTQEGIAFEARVMEMN